MAPPDVTAPQVMEEQLDQDAILDASVEIANELRPVKATGQASAGLEERIQEAAPVTLVPPTLPAVAESEKPDEEPPKKKRIRIKSGLRRRKLKRKGL